MKITNEGLKARICRNLRLELDGKYRTKEQIASFLSEESLVGITADDWNKALTELVKEKVLEEKDGKYRMLIGEDFSWEV